MVRFRSSFRFKTNSRRFGIVRRTRSRRIFRRLRGRMMSRRRQKPELKYWRLAANQITIAAGGLAAGTITPNSMAHGTDIGQRVGNKIKLMRCKYTVFFRGGDAPQTRPSGNVRVIIWSPRVSPDDAVAYMALLDALEPVDYNVATVHRDQYLSIGAVGAGTVGGINQIIQAPLRTEIIKKYVIPFPRRCEFVPGNDRIEPMNYLYVNIYNKTNFPILYDYDTRVTYTDA